MSLSDFERYVIEEKGTEPPYTGQYTDAEYAGIFQCKRCQTPLFEAKSKFKSHCGWPSFDAALNQVQSCPDADGHRTEILCQNCQAHLGHVFTGEGFTQTNRRYCVNAVAITYQAPREGEYAEIVLGGGCFWCLDAIFRQFKAVISVESGYAGGKKEDASYAQVSTGQTDHAEVVRIGYNPRTLPLEAVLDIFFHAHDPTTLNYQGHDQGRQYRSVIFYQTAQERQQAQSVIDAIESQQVWSHPVVTTLEALPCFYRAEVEHQNFLHGKQGKGTAKQLFNPNCKK